MLWGLCKTFLYICAIQLLFYFCRGLLAVMRACPCFKITFELK